MTNKVVLVSVLDDYSGECPEVWGVNLAFKYHPTINRVYFFDNPANISPSFVPHLNGYVSGSDRDVQVYARRPFPEVKNCRVYPFSDIVADLCMDYFTSSISYMIAHAIYEGFDEIEMVGMFDEEDSLEYMPQKPCVEAWLGFAIARGIKIKMGSGTSLLKPYRWQSPRYGYVRQRNDHLCMQTLAGAHRAINSYPISFYNLDDETDEQAEQYARTMALLVKDAAKHLMRQDWFDRKVIGRYRKESNHASSHRDRDP